MSFTVRLRASGVTLSVPAGRSVLQTIEDAGIAVDSLCRDGVCGTCEQRVLAGEPEHRDAFLTPAERAANTTMLVCVSRARDGTVLVLDL